MDKSKNINDFQIISKLGEGAFGQVFKVKRKQTGEVYALKKIKTSTMKQKDKINALNQIRILASMQGENIIGYKDSFYDQISSNLCIVLQFAGQGDIMKKINDHSKKKKFIQEAEIWKAMVQIARGIRTLHDNNILHRDLKSANIFISEDGTYKLGDLNISKVLKQGLARTQTGTPYYCSPQVWQDKPYGPKSDMWSFGCVLYEMAAQKPPFTATDIQGLYRKICAGSFQRIPNHYSNQLSDVINSLLKLNPSLRPSTHDILKNPIVQSHYGGKDAYQPSTKNSDLLKTIQLNNRGWRSLNNSLPKPKYKENQINEEDEKYNSQSNKQSQHKVPFSIKISRPFSSGSYKKYVRNILEPQNQSQIKNSDNLQKQPSVPSISARKQRVLSAYKKPSVQLMETPEKQNNKNLALPPIDPARSKRSRRGSENNYDHMLPPKSREIRTSSKSSRGSSSQKNQRSQQKSRLQRAGLQVLNNGQHRNNYLQ